MSLKESRLCRERNWRLSKQKVVKLDQVYFKHIDLILSNHTIVRKIWAGTMVATQYFAHKSTWLMAVDRMWGRYKWIKKEKTGNQQKQDALPWRYCNQYGNIGAQYGLWNFLSAIYNIFMALQFSICWPCVHMRLDAINRASILPTGKKTYCTFSLHLLRIQITSPLSHNGLKFNDIAV